MEKNDFILRGEMSPARQLQLEIGARNRERLKKMFADPNWRPPAGIREILSWVQVKQLRQDYIKNRFPSIQALADHYGISKRSATGIGRGKSRLKDNSLPSLNERKRDYELRWGEPFPEEALRLMYDL